MRRFFRRNTDGPHNHTIIHQLLLQFLRHYREFSPATLVIIAAKKTEFHFKGMHRLEIERCDEIHMIRDDLIKMITSYLVMKI